MFFEPGHHLEQGLPHNPFKGCVLPRPIAWISSQSAAGVCNLAPFSYFNAFSDEPPIIGVGFSPDGREEGIKDSLRNILETGEFVFNLVSWEQRTAMNESSKPVPFDQDEFEAAGLEKLPSKLVTPPRVKGAPVHFECRLFKSLDLPANAAGQHSTMVLGEVVGIHIDESCLTDGLVDATKMRPLARLGYQDYAVINEVFQLVRPKAG
ncbi:flavin reductase family protein [Kiloniella laminariae]|uniref:Flavin reductase family protein n=1 Tax=Kiloniella laminariae TaxID=454162 RepID=A0ABT4LI01_9PROT|nr:flavin reductase family protein [Kiloniella laminariae]MCZ4280730.1 flavin reductase family protein [Kiloniella laminariae]